MLKKSLASLVSAAVILAAPGHMAVSAAAQTLARPVSVKASVPALAAPGARAAAAIPSLGVPALAVSPIAGAASEQPSAAAPAAAAAEAAAPAAPAAEAEAAHNVFVSLVKAAFAEPAEEPARAGAALDRTYDNAAQVQHEKIMVVSGGGMTTTWGRMSLRRSAATTSSSRTSVPDARGKSGGVVLETAAVGAALLGAAYAFSKPFRDIVSRLWNVTLGRLSLFAKKAETPEVLAQRVIDQLNAAKPVYNEKVKNASTLVEKLKLQVAGEQKQRDELERSITAILSDNDPSNDTLAAGMIKQQQTLDASIAATQEQTKLAETSLEQIKEERARFFSEREETIAKIQAKLSQVESARIQKEIAELKGGFQLGGLKDNLDKLDKAVDDEVAKSKGTVDSVESNPDEILKKAKDSVKTQEIQDEIAKRKAAIEAARKDKGASSARVSPLLPVGTLILLAGIATQAYAVVLAATLLMLVGVLTSDDLRGRSGGLVGEAAVAAAGLFAVAYAFSKPFRDIVSRLWNVTLGRLSLFAKKAETPEVLAQRVIDQLNAAKPVYNEKVKNASILVAKLELQIEGQKKQSAELDQSVNAILSDSDPSNDKMAESLLSQKATVDASTKASEEQLGIARTALEHIKEERARFFSEREETIAKVQARLSQVESARIQKEIAELKGGFQLGDVKDNLDKLDKAVDEEIAKSKGTVDSVESNPDEILKKAKDSFKDQAVQEEIAKRKAAIEAAKKAKGGSGGKLARIDLAVFSGAAVMLGGLFAKNVIAIGAGLALMLLPLPGGRQGSGGALGLGQAVLWLGRAVFIGGALIAPLLTAAAFAGIGLLAVVMEPAYGKKVGRELAIVGLGTALLGGGALVLGAKLGFVLFSARFAVPAGIALTAGVLSLLRARGAASTAAAQAAASTPAGAAVLKESSAAGTAARTAGAAAAEAARKAGELAGKAGDAVKKGAEAAGKAAVDAADKGVKKLETPEVMAQLVIDQLEAAGRDYMAKVRDAATLVASIEGQIAAEKAKIAEYDGVIDSILHDNDPTNDIKAAGLITEKQALEASVKDSEEQLALAKNSLEHIKDERRAFYAERVHTMNELAKGMVYTSAAGYKARIAALKARFDGAAADAAAAAAGAQASATDALADAKAAQRDAQVAEELARRKAAAQKDKGASSAALSGGAKLGVGFAAMLAVTSLPYVALVLILMGSLLTMVGVMPWSSSVSNFFASTAIGAAIGAALSIGTPLLLPAVLATLAATMGYFAVVSTRGSSGGAAGAGLGAILSRLWNATLGRLSLFAKKAETPEVLAQRVVDQLNAAKPVYNEKVKNASTLVEKLRLQIERQQKDAAELDRSVTAILSDSDPNNDAMAESLLKQKKTLDDSTEATKTQLAAAEKGLETIKDERARFFSEREETIARINARLSQVEAARIQREIAELKGGFELGGLKDNLDRLDKAVDEEVAKSKGTVDSVESNPDEILRKAKDSFKNQAVQDEIAKRKAAIAAAKADKGAGAGALTSGGKAAVILGGVAVAALLGISLATIGSVLGAYAGYLTYTRMSASMPAQNPGMQLVVSIVFSFVGSMFGSMLGGFVASLI